MMAYLLYIMLFGDQTHDFYFEGGLLNLKFIKVKMIVLSKSKT